MIEQNVFTCGIGQKLFKEKYDCLNEADKDRLVRVSERVWLTIKLRYEQAFIHNPFAWKFGEFNLQYEELPSIEVYLLCTCLDTLAGKSDFKDFNEWLKYQKIKEPLSVVEVISLYDKYEFDYGIGKNIRKLFTDLPECFKDWLVNNVKLLNEGKPVSVSEDYKTTLVLNLYKFFYEYLRNTYTHSSMSRRIKIADNIFEPIDNGVWVTPVEGSYFPLKRGKKNQLWNFSYREGLDLATVLRLIIYAAVIQFVGFELTPDLISKNVRMYSRLNAFYAFINEMSDNSNFLIYLEKLEEQELLRSELLYISFPLLNHAASKIVLDRYTAEGFHEASYREMTEQYISEVNYINSEIIKFNEINPPSMRPKNNRPLVIQIIKEFIKNLKSLPTFIIIKDLPRKNEMINFWILINNPCETL